MDPGNDSGRLGQPPRRPATSQITAATNEQDRTQRTTADCLEPVALAVLLSTLPTAHVLVNAARLGIEVGQLREAHWRAVRDAGKDVHGADTKLWRRVAGEHVTFDELRKRRGAA